MRIGRLHFGLKFAWYDLWLGLFWDRKKRRLYLGIPMFVLWFEWWSRTQHRDWQFHSELAEKLPGTPLKFEGAMVGHCVKSHVNKDGTQVITDFKLDRVDLVPDLLHGAKVSMSTRKNREKA